MNKRSRLLSVSALTLAFATTEAGAVIRMRSIVPLANAVKTSPALRTSLYELGDLTRTLRIEPGLTPAYLHAISATQPADQPKTAAAGIAAAIIVQPEMSRRAVQALGDATTKATAARLVRSAKGLALAQEAEHLDNRLNVYRGLHGRVDKTIQNLISRVAGHAMDLGDGFAVEATGKELTRVFDGMEAPAAVAPAPAAEATSEQLSWGNFAHRMTPKVAPIARDALMYETERGGEGAKEAIADWDRLLNLYHASARYPASVDAEAANAEVYTLFNRLMSRYARGYRIVPQNPAETREAAALAKLYSPMHDIYNAYYRTSMYGD